VNVINKSVTQIIEKYLEECLFEPESDWPRCEFERRVYSRWAVAEIIRRIEEGTEPPMIVIKDFIGQMYAFAEINEDTVPSEIFLIAFNAAEDILLYLETGYSERDYLMDPWRFEERRPL